MGACQLQADVALFELFKKGIFNASLICSDPLDQETQHWYLMILDEHTFKTLPQVSGVYAAVKPNGFNKTSLFFDTWSNQLCTWQDFTPDAKSSYLKNLKKLTQAMFKPLLHLFEDEVAVLENINWCLTEYEKCLTKLTPAAEEIPREYTQLFSSPADEFQKEVEFLFDSKKCIAQLLSTIEIERKEFQKRLETIKSTDKKFIAEENITEKDKALDRITSSFFAHKQPSEWKPYPATKLAGTKYSGHQVRFLTLPETTSEEAAAFADHLQKAGIAAELKAAKNKPSIVVDLNVSTFKM